MTSPSTLLKIQHERTEVFETSPLKKQKSTPTRDIVRLAAGSGETYTDAPILAPKRPRTQVSDPFNFSILREELSAISSGPTTHRTGLPTTPVEKKTRKRSAAKSSERNVKSHITLATRALNERTKNDVSRFKENPKDTSIIHIGNWLELYKIACESEYLELQKACQEFAEYNLHLSNITKDISQTLEFHKFLNNASGAFFDKIVTEMVENFSNVKCRSSFERLSFNIKRLDFANSKSLTADSLAYFARVCPHIEELDISKTVISTLAHSLKQLKIINMSYTPISQEALDEFARKTPNIRELYARYTKIERVPPQLTQLKIVDLAKTKLTQEALEAALKSNPDLEKVNVERNPQLTHSLLTSLK